MVVRPRHMLPLCGRSDVYELIKRYSFGKNILFFYRPCVGLRREHILILGLSQSTVLATVNQTLITRTAPQIMHSLYTAQYDAIEEKRSIHAYHVIHLLMYLFIL